jgi:hypothetical protein
MLPNVFIGSSVEAKDVAGAIQLGLQHDARCTVWHQSFPLSKTTLDSLLNKSADCDFAVFVLSADDTAKIRGTDFIVARDNVIFESGLFMGGHGKERVFIVLPRDPSFHLPTDLLGFTPATYDPSWARSDVNAALGAVVTQINQAIKNSYWTNRNLDISASASLVSTATWPLKLNLTITNHQLLPVAIESTEFLYDPSAPPAPNRELQRRLYIPHFLIGRTTDGRDIYHRYYVLQPTRSIGAWVPFDPHFGLVNLQSSAASKNTGTWKFRCVWLNKFPDSQRHEVKF